MNIPNHIPAIVRRLRDFEDDSAWHRFSARYEATMRRLASRWRIDGASVDDTIQNALARIVRFLPAFRETDRPRGFQRWACTIGLNELRRTLRTGARTSATITSYARQLPPADVIPELLETAERRRQLASAVRSLEPTGRAVLVLSTIKDMSAHDVADLLSITVSRVSQLKWRASCRLRKALVAAQAERRHHDTGGASTLTGDTPP